MHSYLAEFTRKVKGDDFVEYRELNTRKWGCADYRLKLTPVATIQRRVPGSDTDDEWEDVQSFDDINIAAMVAMDSVLNCVPSHWPEDHEEPERPEEDNYIPAPEDRVGPEWENSET